MTKAFQILAAASALLLAAAGCASGSGDDETIERLEDRISELEDELAKEQDDAITATPTPGATEGATVASTPTATPTVDRSGEYEEALLVAVEEFRSAEDLPGDTRGWASMAVTYRVLAAVVDSLDTPTEAIGEHERLLVLLEEGAKAYEDADEICERMATNMAYEAAGLQPEPGDDNCLGAGVQARSADTAVSDALEAVVAGLQVGG